MSVRPLELKRTQASREPRISLLASDDTSGRCRWNIGTSFAFVLVSIGVIVLRRVRPELERPFRAPLVPLLPILSALASI